MVDRSLTPPAYLPPAFPPLVEAFLDWARVERGFSAQTISTYRRLITRFVAEAYVPTAQAITAAHVLRVKRALMNRGCSASYIATIMLAIRSFLTYCRDIGGIAVLDPKLVTPPRRPRKPVTFLTRDEVERFIGSIKLETRWDGRTRRRRAYLPGVLFRGLVEVLLGTGMRISEALSLNRTDIDWVKQEARVTGKGAKTRTVFFTSRSLHWLKRFVELRRDSRPEIFVTENGRMPMNRHMVGRRFRYQSKKAGLNKGVTAHMLRHTVATTLMFNGCPMGHIKEILGHERLDTTCRYYLGLDQREARKAHERYLRYEADDNSEATSINGF